MNDKTNKVHADDVREGTLITAQESATPGQLIASAEFRTRLEWAKANPRQITEFVQEAKDLVSLNEDTARDCIFALPRGRDDEGNKKYIEGPSVRLAEILFSRYRNCEVASRISSIGSETVVADGVFIDNETSSRVIKSSERRIVDNKGKRYNLDMIVMTSNAAQSIAMRNAILVGIPQALWRAVYSQARHMAAGGAKPLTTMRKEAIDAFAIYGVSPEQIFAKMEIAGEMDLSRNDLVVLFGFLTSIKSEEIKPEELFPPVETKTRKREPDAQKEETKKPPAETITPKTETNTVQPETTVAQPATETKTETVDTGKKRRPMME